MCLLKLSIKHKITSMYNTIKIPLQWIAGSSLLTTTSWLDTHSGVIDRFLYEVMLGFPVSVEVTEIGDPSSNPRQIVAFHFMLIPVRNKLGKPGSIDLVKQPV